MNRSDPFANLASTLAALIVPSLPAAAQRHPDTVIKGPGYTLTARAYVDPTRLSHPKHNPPSRYDLRLSQPANARYRWDFVLPGSRFSRVSADASIGSPDYRFRTHTVIHATLRQFDTHVEKVTFRGIALAPRRASESRDSFSPRALLLGETRSVTTSSGITVTLPAQSYDAIRLPLAGNPNALFVMIRVTPRENLVRSLPRSPLFQKHRRPVRLQLGLPMHVYGRQDIYYRDDVTPVFGRVALPIADLKTAMHLDELTFHVLQRIDLQTVPVAIRVPISRPAPPLSRPAG